MSWSSYVESFQPSVLAASEEPLVTAKRPLMFVVSWSCAELPHEAPEPHAEALRKTKILRTLKDALQSPEAPHWRQARTVEMTRHKKTKTYQQVNRPKRSRPKLTGSPKPD